MAKQGRGGAALAIAAIGSFVGGTFATIALVIAAGPLTGIALMFGPVEFFALIAVGLSLLMGLAGKSMIKALMMGVFGMVLPMIGMDPVRGLPRFTFGSMELMDGIGFVPVIMGAFMMHGLIPGPFLFKEHPHIVWGTIASFYVGNVMLLILNLPLVGIWVKILKIPYGLLFGVILCLMVVGAYSINSSAFGILIMTLFGVIG